jgi:hypothetical protein
VKRVSWILCAIAVLTCSGIPSGRADDGTRKAAEALEASAKKVEDLTFRAGVLIGFNETKAQRKPEEVEAIKKGFAEARKIEADARKEAAALKAPDIALAADYIKAFRRYIDTSTERSSKQMDAIIQVLENKALTKEQKQKAIEACTKGERDTGYAEFMKIRRAFAKMHGLSAPK